MFKILSTQSISAVAAAALIGCFAALLVPVAPPATAQTQSSATVLDRVHAKADRLPRLVTGRGCSSASWPNYDQACQFDLRRSADDVRVVRIVSMEKTGSAIVPVKH
jgi:hypothetical protein